MSPDRTRKAEFTADGTLIVTPLPSGAPRTLVFHPNDRRAVHPGCCKWLDDRYLELRGRHYAFIDTDTMKVSFAPDTGDDDDLTIAPGMTIALVHRKDGMYLATITKP